MNCSVFFKKIISLSQNNEILKKTGSKYNDFSLLDYYIIMNGNHHAFTNVMDGELHAPLSLIYYRKWQ